MTINQSWIWKCKHLVDCACCIWKLFLFAILYYDYCLLAFCMNNKFILYFQFFCKKSKEHKSHQQHCCSNSSSGAIAHNPGCDFEGLSEKYWGEILERTLSSSSLYALQRAYSHPRIERCNGLQEMKVFDTAVPDLWKLDKTTQTFDILAPDSMGSSAETAIVSK